MRIFLIGGSNLAPDSMEKHVYEVLGEMGHTVGFCNARGAVQVNPTVDRLANFVANNILREPERLSEKRVLRSVSEFQPELIIVLLGSQLSPKTIAKVRKVFLGKIVCWCQDQLTTMGRQYLIGAEYDHVFVKDHYLVEVLGGYAGLNVQYLPEACNPKYHQMVTLSDTELESYRSDICTFGNLYYYRQAILEPLKKYDLRVYGGKSSWFIDKLGDSFKGYPVYELEKCKALSGATIALNSLHFGEIYGLNVRAFEIAGCGGFQLSTYTPTIQDHFEIGTEIEVFKDRHELLEKVDYFLQHPDKAKAIAEAGHKRAYSEHTYQHRLKTIVEVATQ